MSIAISIHANGTHRIAAVAKQSDKYGHAAHWVNIHIDRDQPIGIFVSSAEEADALAAAFNELQARRDAAREVAA